MLPQENCMTSKKKILFNCGTYLATVWIVSSIPLAFVLYEFNDIHLEGCRASLGWFAATLYGSLFIYPVFIGGLSMAALLLPLATTITLAKKSRTTLLVLSGFYAVTAITVVVFEFVYSPHAVFEVPPGVLRANPSFVASLEDTCRNTPFTKYQDELRDLVRSGRSYTAWAYYVGFIAQTLMQNALFVVFLAFISFPKKQIVHAAPYLKDTIFYVLGYSIFLGSLWCLFRLTYRNEIAALFGGNPFGGDYAIVVLYAFVLMVFVVYFEFGLEKLAKTLSHLGQFLVFALGVIAVHYNQASIFFGRQASPGNILVLFVLFLFISAITLALLLKRPR